MFSPQMERGLYRLIERFVKAFERYVVAFEKRDKD